MKKNKEVVILVAAKEVPLYNIPMMSDEQWNELAKRKVRV